MGIQTGYINSYHLETAERLLGSANFNILSPEASCFEVLCNTINDIWITVLRVINFLFGDGLWYNNEVATSLVRTYCNSPNSYPQVSDRITSIYNKLQCRAYSLECCQQSNRSWASTIQSLYDNTFGRGMGLGGDNDIFAFPMVPQGPFDSHFDTGEKTGNITVRTTLEAREQLNIGEYGDVIPLDTDVIKAITENVESLNPIEPEGQNVESLKDILAPRLYRSKFPDKKLPTRIESEQHPTFNGVSDPHEFFARGLVHVLQERGINLSDLNMVFNNETLMRSVYKDLILFIINQASLFTACDSVLYLNDEQTGLSIQYAKPTIIVTMVSGQPDYKVIYGADILSSWDVGCDPIAAKALLNEINSDPNTLATFKAYLLIENSDDDIEGVSEEFKVLKTLIEVMANQAEQRYNRTIRKMAPRIINQEPIEIATADATYSALLSNAESPYQVITRTLFTAGKQLADCGLMAPEDTMGECYSDLRAFICYRAIFAMLRASQIESDFSLKLTNDVSIPCRSYYVYSEGEGAKLLYVPNELGGDDIAVKGEIRFPASDPIAAKYWMSRLTPQQLSFAQEWICAPYLVAIYRSKGITDQNTLGMDGYLRAAFAQLSGETQAIMNHLRDELLKIYEHVSEHYYPDVATFIEGMEEKDNDNGIEGPDRFFKPDAQPTPIRARPTITDTITQEVLIKYLSDGINPNDVVIKSKLVRTTELPSTSKVSKVELNRNRLGAIDKQHYIDTNPARIGNCMFGALSMALFGQNSEWHCTKLRESASAYMLDNSDQFLAIGMEGIQPFSWESDATFNARLLRALKEHCLSLPQSHEYGSIRELEAIASVFGVRIEILDYNNPNPMMVGTEGIDDGVILPNVVAGARFSGVPVRLCYSGNHYQNLRFKM